MLMREGEAFLLVMSGKRAASIHLVSLTMLNDMAKNSYLFLFLLIFFAFLMPLMNLHEFICTVRKRLEHS